MIVGQDKCIKEIVAFFINRTCGEPFSFEFRGHTCDVYPILMDLVVHSEQWETVSIQLRQSQLGYLCGAMGRLPLLKKLNILVEDHGTTGNTIPTMISNIFEDAPHLTHVVVSDAAVRQFKFGWTSLTFNSQKVGSYSSGDHCDRSEQRAESDVDELKDFARPLPR